MAAQLPQKIKEWVTGQDGLDKLRIQETDLPTPGEDEVLVEVSAVSMNYRDTEGLRTPLANENRLLTLYSRYGSL